MDYSWEFKYYPEAGSATLFRDKLAYASTKSHLMQDHDITPFDKIHRIIKFVSQVIHDIVITMDELSPKSLASLMLTTSKITRDLANQLNVFGTIQANASTSNA